MSLSDLSAFDGQDPSKPIYVAIKGKVFDVSAKREMYGPGAGYNIFAGKDASKGLGESHVINEGLVDQCRHVVAGPQGCCRRLLVSDRGPSEDTGSMGSVLRKGAPTEKSSSVQY